VRKIGLEGKGQRDPRTALFSLFFPFSFEKSTTGRGRSFQNCGRKRVRSEHSKRGLMMNFDPDPGVDQGKEERRRRSGNFAFDEFERQLGRTA